MKCVTLWMLLASPTLAAGAPPAPPPTMHFEAISTPPPSADAGASAELAMQSDGNARMTVPVSLGARAYHFLVDTGSERTSVSRELVRELGLQERAPAVMHSATGQSDVHMAYLPELRLNRRAVRNISAPMLGADDMGADGILGIDSLRSQRVVFDFAHGSLSIISGDDPAAIDRDAIVVRAKRRDGRLIVTDARIDGVRVTVVVDSGSSLTVGNEALRRRLGHGGKLSAVGPVSLTSVTGAVLRGELVTAGRLEIGGVRLEGLEIAFAEAHTFRLLQLDKQPAILLGMNALMGFDQVAIDFAGKTLSLVLPKGGKRATAS
jgi:predicted aspartyl protease